MKLPRILAAVACLMGAGGVIAAAGSGHGGGDSRLAAAAQMLLVHAVASLVLALASSRIRWLAPVAAVMQAAACLFAGDMAVRVFAGHALFPLAAPVGGTAMILAWLVAAIAFCLTPRTGQEPGDWAG